ncbi:MAG: ABC transporter permease [Candidatus Pacearchaeota archaeon]|nr:ABC transporter permease [Candidatus Pacearchaeota archaeon]
MLGDYFVLALKNLRHRGIRSWLTMLGIFIGIAAVVSLITLGQGLRTAIEGQFGGLSVDTLTVQNKGAGFGPPGSTVIKKLNENDLKIIQEISGVDIVVPRLIRVASLEYNKISGFSFITDIPEGKEERNFVYDNLGLETEIGTLLNREDNKKIILGNNFLDTDDFDKEFVIGKNVKINGIEFEIIGILKPSSTFQLNGVIFMANGDLEDLLKIKGEYDLFIVKILEKDRIKEIGETIEDKLRRDRKEKIGEESFTVETPLQTLDSVNIILNIINLVVIGIASISLFVGGVGIANTMYTSVIERTKEIGIMKAVGARNSEIVKLFLIESGLLGLVGGIVGALIGIGGAFGVSILANQALGGNLFEVIISYPLIIAAIGFSFMVGIISGVLPALRASKLNVVEALRD